MKTALNSNLVRVAAISGASLFAMTTAAVAQIDVVTVTARKKEENLQDVPASITALSQEQIERGFLQDIRDIQNSVPNLVFDEVNVGSAANAAITMRGVGFQDVEKSFDPAVGVMVDGFFLGSPNGSIYKTLDVERIEILRGPQGTLFGKNTIGGLIHVIRAEPTGEFGGTIRAQGGRFGRYGVDALLNLPEWNGFSLKGTFSIHRGDGFFNNVVTDETVGELEYIAYGVNALFEPSDRFKIDYRFDRYEDDSDVTPLVNNSSPTSVSCTGFGACGTGVNNANSAFGGRYNVGSETDYNLSFFNNTTHILTAEWEAAENYTLKYIGGYQKTAEDITNNFGGFNIDAMVFGDDQFYTGRRAQEYSQYSNELQLIASPTDRIDVVVGAFQWHAEYEMQQDFFSALFPIPGTPGIDPLNSTDLLQNTRHNTDSWSLFGEVNIAVTDALELTGGVRYIDEDKEICSRFAVPLSLYGGSDVVLFDSCDNPASTDVAAATLTGATLTRYLGGFRPTEDWQDVIWKGSIKYDWTDDINTWFTYSTGFKSGGFNGRGQSFASSSTPYDPEKVTSYEVGLHSQLFDDRVQFNIAYFYTSYKDLQLDANVPVALGSGQETIVTNAASARIQGIEIDSIVQPAPGWTLTGSFGWLDADYRDFFADILGTGTPVDNSGFALRRAPEFSFSINSVYEQEIGPGVASFRVNFAWKDRYETLLTNNPFSSIDPYGILDMSLNYDWDNYSVSVFGRNITDQNYYTHAFAVPLNESLWNFGVPREPAVWGVEVSAKF